MFFDDADLVSKRRATLKALPPVPETGWRPPTEYPNLTAATVIGFDVETKETDWKYGPGWARGPKGNIVGFSVAARDRLGNSGRWYFPIRHEHEPEFNLDPNNSLAWLRYWLHTQHIPKVGANLLYDCGWLTEENIFVQGDLHDIQYAEALIDEEAKVALDILGWKYEREGKASEQIRQWITAAYNPRKDDWRSEIWRTSPRLVGPYGEQDADLPIRILGKQWPTLVREGLMNVYRMECRLIPLLIMMRRAGVRVDLDEAGRQHAAITADIGTLETRLYDETGVRANVNSAEELARVFDAAGIEYPYTDALKPKPSFRKDFLKNLDHPIATLVNDIREHYKVRDTFIESYILNSNTKGRLYCQFHPMHGEGGGTKVGRFSSSHPNLQNIPVRTELGKRVRTIFKPDYLKWRKRDYSQLQYRYLAHYAVDEGDGSAERLRQRYISDPNTDYHGDVQKEFEKKTGKKLERRPIKNMNFGLVFGLGKGKLIRSTGITGKAGQQFYNDYHEAAPYVKPTMAAMAQEVHTYGFITSPLGRRVRFKLWEPIFDNNDHRQPALPYESAIQTYGNAIKLANDYVGIAYKLQSAEGDQMKLSMVTCWEQGIFNVTGVPRLTVHDELDHDVIDFSPRQTEAYEAQKHIMETCIPLRIPIRVDTSDADNWGAAKD